MFQLETSNLPQTKKWFTPLIYVVYSARNLNTYIHTYIYTYVSQLETNNLPQKKSGLLWSLIWFTQHEI